jgi:hypothetical protein
VAADLRITARVLMGYAGSAASPCPWRRHRHNATLCPAGCAGRRGRR